MTRAEVLNLVREIISSRRWYAKHADLHASGGADEVSGSGGVTDHGALTGLLDDDHTQYVALLDADYVDLTDGGATTLHTHAGGSGHTIRENGTDQTARTGLNFVDAAAGAGLITDDAGGNETEVNLNLYILKSTFAAKGDLLGASANDTPAIVTAGANGTMPMYDSSQTAGIKATHPALAAWALG